MNDLVSVIVPIYKVEFYLGKCVDSIINQTYSNLEIILVDDGSPDNCGKICDEYKQKDNRIKVIHKQNGGLSDARNAGIDIATGRYIVFIDSDDYINNKMIEYLYSGITNNNADVSVCGVKKVKDGEAQIFEEINHPDVIILKSNEDKTEFYFESNYEEFTVAWNKMYPAEYFKGIRYPKGKIHEDEFTTYKLLEKANRVAFIKDKLYYYVQRGDSIMGESFNEKRLLRLDAYLERLEHYKKIKKFDWFDKILFLYKLFLIRYANEIKNRDDMDLAILKKYKKAYRKNVFSIITKSNISAKKKCSYLLYALYPGVCYRK